MTPIDVLTEAKRLIEERGWCRFYYVDDKGCMCLSGALRLAAGARLTRWGEESSEDADVPESSLRAYFDARDAIKGEIDRAIIAWNDHPFRTKDQVIAALNKAIATLA